MLYFDHSATTPLRSEVKELMQSINDNNYGNPSSIYALGQKARSIVETARKQVADAIGASSDQILFTSSGTESNNQVLWTLIFSRKKHVIASAIEHPAVVKVLKNLGPLGISYTLLPVNNLGIVNLSALVPALQKDTELISIMLANNEVGSIQPIKETVKIAREYNIPVHTDAVQGLGKIPIDTHFLGVDFLSLSAHKFYGPKGVGVLFVKDKKKIKSLMIGGSQESGLRAGTENVAGVAGLGLAAKLANDKLSSHSEHLNKLETIFRKKLNKINPNLVFHGDHHHCLPGVISVSFPGQKANLLMARLDRYGLAVSSGSACSAGNIAPSAVLNAMNVDDSLNRATLRISFGAGNTQDDVEELLSGLKKALKP
ncbi:MAG: cysteine desulfurase family protein [Candidatus Neomarinimicrobiota bacterium]|nr:cysteine desulfurase family protein [Candidatus Neomarinimicrobiota bacterium]